jgi:nitroreductase
MPVMKLNLTADQVLSTTRSVRKRLDFDRPVDRVTVMECLDVALQAPTGSNKQHWQWMFVSDPAKKLALAELYRTNFDQYRQKPQAEYASGDPRGYQYDAVKDSATFLAENFEHAPVLMIPCIHGKVEQMDVASSAAAWGSLLPAAWSMMLALRERGLGSAWTTIHLMNGGDRVAADLLGIPNDEYTQGGLFPIAYTKGTDFKPAKRLPAADFSHWDSW